MYVIHGTRKFLERVGAPSRAEVGDSTTVLGDWYATVLFWKPQAGLFVNESTLLPVLLPFAPAATIVVRFPAALAAVLRRRGIGEAFIEAEREAMDDNRLAKTKDRGVVGMMTEFAFLSGAYAKSEDAVDLVELSLWLARTPCGPLDSRQGSPDRELAAHIARRGGWLRHRPPPPRRSRRDERNRLVLRSGDSPTSEEGPWLTGLSCCTPTTDCRSSPTHAR